MNSNMHKDLLAIAREEIPRHIEVVNDGDDKGRYFDLTGYLRSLESRLISVLEGRDSFAGAFKLCPSEVARYIWCCVAMEERQSPSGDTFRGMYVLE